MPSATSFVGPLELPVPAGVLNSAIDDPTLTGLLAYLAHCIKVALDAKLTNLQGTSADACPTANRFPWDPASYFVRGRQDGDPVPFPALYLWREGRGKIVTYSTVLDMRETPLGLLYVFDELIYPGSMETRFGLLNAVDAAVARALSWRYHPTFGLNGGAVGVPIHVALGLAGNGVVYEGAEQGRMAPVPGESRARGGGPEGHNLHAYPTLRGYLRVWEMVEQAQPLDPEDVGQEILVTQRVAAEGDIDDPVDGIARYIPKPDGTENFPL